MYKNYAKIKSRILAANPHKMGILKKILKIMGKNCLDFARILYILGQNACGHWNFNADSHFNRFITVEISMFFNV